MGTQKELSSTGATEFKDQSFLPGVGGPEHLVPRLLAARAALAKSSYKDHAKNLVRLICALQSDNPLARRLVTIWEAPADAPRAAGTCDGERTPLRESNDWSKDSLGVLRYKNRVYVPNDGAIRAGILKQNHDSPLAGHFRRARTAELIARKYYWPGLTLEVKEYV